MNNIFITVLNMSVTASLVAAVVMLARLLLKKAPKIFSYALWAVVLFRMLCPFSFESIVSILPTKPEPIPQDIAAQTVPRIDSGITFVDNSVNRTIQTALSPVTPETVGNSVSPMQVIISVGYVVWLLGIVILLGYAVISYIKVKRRIFAATLVGENIFETDRIKTPFVMGFIKPKIYIPTGLNESETEYIIKHERTHIRRGDHLIKLLAFIGLAVHWFNPLMWASYFLMSKDMELSCDESVMKRSGEDIRASYSKSLLSLSVKQSGLPNPLAFGESNVKSRIKNVLHYKKPAFWISIISVIIVLSVTVALAANQRTAQPQILSAQEALDELKNSIQYENGELSFQIPADYPTSADWIIWINGTIPMTPYDSNMTWHFAEGDEANLNKSWKAGKRYTISNVETSNNFNGLSMDAYLPDENGELIELNVDLMEYISNNNDSREFARAFGSYFGDINSPDSQSVLQYWDTGSEKIKFETVPDTSTNQYVLKINDNKVDIDTLLWFNQIFVMNDVIIITTGATDIRSTHLYIFDFNGNTLFKAYYLNNKGMVIQSSISVVGNKIIIPGTRLTHGIDLVMINEWSVHPEYSDYIYQDIIYDYPDIYGKSEVYLEDSKIKAMLNKDEIVEANFELEYLGNGKFSKIYMSGNIKTLGKYLEE